MAKIKTIDVSFHTLLFFETEWGGILGPGKELEPEETLMAPAQTARNTIVRGEIVPAKGRWSARLEPGQTLKMIDTEGQQAIDFLCYSAELPFDRINIPTTVRLNKSLYITKGSKIYSDRARTMMSVLEDTCGFHDTLAGCCSCEIDKVRYGVDKTESCRTNFIAELAGWGMSPSEIVSNINFFMRVKFGADGELTIADGVSRPGDYVVLRAEMPVIVVISNCPQENNPAAGFAPTPIEVVVGEAP
jgi:urea carboxylase-associated protein 1